MESIEQVWCGDPLCGRATSTLSRNGDLIHKLYLQQTICVKTNSKSLENNLVCCDDKTSDSKGGGLYIYNPTHTGIDNIEIEIGGQLIDRHSGKWMEVYSQLNEPNSAGIFSMVGSNGGTKFQNMARAGGVIVTSLGSIVDKVGSGQVEILNKILAKDLFNKNDTINTKFDAYVPLRFWFCKNAGLALPLIALQYHEVKINLELNKNIVTENALNMGNQIKYECNRLFADYIYLDTDERRRFAQVSHEYLIEQIQTLHFANTGGDLKLNFNHPVKELIWTGGQNDRTGLFGKLPGSSTDYNSNDYYNVKNDITYSLQLNGTQRMSERPLEYYTKQQVYDYHSGTPVGSGDVFIYSDCCLKYNYEDYDPHAHNRPHKPHNLDDPYPGPGPHGGYTGDYVLTLFQNKNSNNVYKIQLNITEIGSSVTDEEIEDIMLEKEPIFIKLPKNFNNNSDVCAYINTNENYQEFICPKNIDDNLNTSCTIRKIEDDGSGISKTIMINNNDITDENIFYFTFEDNKKLSEKYLFIWNNLELPTPISPIPKTPVSSINISETLKITNTLNTSIKPIILPLEQISDSNKIVYVDLSKHGFVKGDNIKLSVSSTCSCSHTIYISNINKSNINKNYVKIGTYGDNQPSDTILYDTYILPNISYYIKDESIKRSVNYYFQLHSNPPPLPKLYLNPIPNNQSKMSSIDTKKCSTNNQKYNFNSTGTLPQGKYFQLNFSINNCLFNFNNKKAWVLTVPKAVENEAGERILYSSNPKKYYKSVIQNSKGNINGRGILIDKYKKIPRDRASFFTENYFIPIEDTFYIKLNKQYTSVRTIITFIKPEDILKTSQGKDLYWPHNSDALDLPPADSSFPFIFLEWDWNPHNNVFYINTTNVDFTIFPAQLYIKPPVHSEPNKEVLVGLKPLLNANSIETEFNKAGSRYGNDIKKYWATENINIKPGNIIIEKKNYRYNKIIPPNKISSQNLFKLNHGNYYKYFNQYIITVLKNKSHPFNKENGLNINQYACKTTGPDKNQRKCDYFNNNGPFRGISSNKSIYYKKLNDMFTEAKKNGGLIIGSDSSWNRGNIGYDKQHLKQDSKKYCDYGLEFRITFGKRIDIKTSINTKYYNIKYFSYWLPIELILDNSIKITGNTDDWIRFIEGSSNKTEPFIYQDYEINKPVSNRKSYNPKQNQNIWGPKVIENNRGNSAYDFASIRIHNTKNFYKITLQDFNYLSLAYFCNILIATISRGMLNLPNKNITGNDRWSYKNKNISNLHWDNTELYYGQGGHLDISKNTKYGIGNSKKNKVAYCQSYNLYSKILHEHAYFNHIYALSLDDVGVQESLVSFKVPNNNFFITGKFNLTLG